MFDQTVFLKFAWKFMEHKGNMIECKRFMLFSRAVIDLQLMFSQYFLFGPLYYLKRFHCCFIWAQREFGIMWIEMDGDEEDNAMPGLCLGSSCKIVRPWTANWSG